MILTSAVWRADFMRSQLACVLLANVTVLAGCGGGGSEAAADQKPAFTLSLAPTTSSMKAGAEIDIVATVAGTSPGMLEKPTVVWTSPDGGTVVAQAPTGTSGMTSTATFIAPTSAGNYRVIASLKPFPTIAQTAVLTVSSK
ncbi:MAG: hypothetical protein JO370_01710 [Paucibacter sp.]|nr:hypothetical protein [Roseateles sp.]